MSRYAATYTSAVLQMLHEAEKSMDALEPGQHILPRYMHSDLHEFVACVCKELVMLYPGVGDDYSTVLRTFKQHLEQRAHAQTGAQIETPAPAPAVSTSV